MLFFTIAIAAQETVTEAVLVPPPSLPEAAVAVFSTTAQSSWVVAVSTWIGPWDAPGAREAKVHCRVWTVAMTLIAHPVNDGVSVQSKSVPFGSGSLP